MKNEYNDVHAFISKLCIVQGFILIIIGIIGAYYLDNLTFVTALSSFGIGLISIGLAFHSISLANESSRKITSIANLEYDEKIAMIVKYKNRVINKNMWGELENCKNDLTAILNLKEYAVLQKREELIGYILEILQHSHKLSDKKDYRKYNIFHNEILEKALETGIRTKELEKQRIKID